MPGKKSKIRRISFIVNPADVKELPDGNFRITLDISRLFALAQRLMSFINDTNKSPFSKAFARFFRKHYLNKN